MNKTLLLILCDFLLLNLLALTRWEKIEPPRPQLPPVPEMGANAVTRDQELLATMRESLADEQASRTRLAQKLSAADAALAAREQSLQSLQAQRVQLAQQKDAATAALTATRQAAEQLQQKAASATQEAALTRDQLAELRRELAEKQALAQRQQQQLTALRKAGSEARKQIEGLTMAVVVAEQEKNSLRQTADSLKSEVQTERAERLKVQQANAVLAQGVGRLAQTSGELTREIRENRPINANVLFNEFEANRVTAALAVSRPGFFGRVNRAKEASTVLVTDGQRTYALLHVADTPFSLNGNGTDWEQMTVRLTHGGVTRTAGAIRFLAQDPRVIAVPLSGAAAKALGAKVYRLAADPFKFPQAVLIDGHGEGYGEFGFKLDPAHPGFVRVDSRLFKRLLGDFSPQRGDLVFSQTGEFLGVMVNNTYCAIVKNLAPFRTITAGSDIKGGRTGAILDAIGAQIRSLPPALQ